MNNDATPALGLKREITPCFGARLVQEGHRLHFLADRAGFNGSFSEMQARDLDEAFPHFVAHTELMLLSGELNPRCAYCVALYRNELTCEADTLGSHGYVYIAIYPSNLVKA
ncbi:antitoxin YafW [Yersinia rohdei]|uniref:Antitoxin YafW n=1 Tax=Yersinia rohdei TaxID=29485 RepID=A0ABM5SFF8_YERRO|nr:type IV toxin-antitoxin system YeeU family antitoxin [Yersinia rohdei]AJJ11948.1 antitoxin YafW [Yersinia rohdei]